jgi:hypothetical protein
MPTKKTKSVFKDKWIWKYFCTAVKDKPLCLICNETVAVYKVYNISQHFPSKHKNANYGAMAKDERKQKTEDIRTKLSGQQSIFKKLNSSQKAATHVGYVVAYNIAKSNKAFSDGEYDREENLDLLGSLIKNIPRTMLYFYIVSYIKMFCIPYTVYYCLGYEMCLMSLLSLLMLFDLEGLLTDNF